METSISAAHNIIDIYNSHWNKAIWVTKSVFFTCLNFYAKLCFLYNPIWGELVSKETVLRKELENNANLTSSDLNVITYHTMWKVSKYRVFSGSHFPVFSQNTGKYGSEKTPYLDTFHAVSMSLVKVHFYIAIQSSEKTW